MERANLKRAPARGAEEGPFLDQEATLEKSGRVEELIRLYEERARQLPASSQAAEWLSRAGELARDRMRNLSRAEDLFRRALVYAPGSVDALKGLRTVYEQKQDAASLAEVLEQLASAAGGIDGAQLYQRAAEVYEQRMARKDKAVICLQLATRLYPEGKELYRRIRMLLVEERRFQAAFDSLERERAALGNDGMVEEYVNLARELAEDPTDHLLALRALEVALQIEPHHAEAERLQKAVHKFEHTWRDKVRQLRQQSLDERDRRRAARLSLLVAKLFAWYDTSAHTKVREALDRSFLLWPAMPDALALIEGIAQKAGDLGSAAKVLEKMASDAKDKGAQVDLWLRTGILKLTRLEDAEGALTAFERAAKADPSRADAVSLAAELLLEQGHADAAVALFDRHLATLKDRPAQNALRLRLADLCLGAMKDPVAARVHLSAVLASDPNNAEAAFELARLLLADEDLAAIDPLADLVICAPRPVAERLAFCERLATLYMERGNARLAFQARARALTLAPERTDILEGAVEQATQANAVAELVVRLQRLAGICPEPAAIELWRRSAQLLEDPLGKPKEAGAAWQEVLKRSPKDAKAKTAVKALEAPKPAPGKSEQRAQLEAEAKKLEGSAADPNAAAVLYRKMLELDPKDVGALKRLGAACAALSQWQEVAEVASRLAQLSEAESDKQEWRSRLAQLYAERLSRKDEAAEIYLELLGAGSESAAAVGGLERLASQGVRQAEIARALGPHYEKSGDYQRQVASLLVQLSTVQGKAEQKELYRLLATIHEKKLLDSRGALSFWMRGLSTDPTDGDFRGEAVRLARDLGAHAELARFFADLAAKVMEAPRASALLLEAADLAEEGGALDEGLRALNTALERAPDDPDILSRLVRLYLKAGRPTEADEALRRRILVAQPGEKARLYVQLSELSGELNRPREAAQALQEAIKSGASEAELLPRIADFWEKAGRMADFSNALSRLISMAEAWGDRDAVTRLSLRRAQVLEAALGDKGEAIKNYSAILEKRPSDPDALTALEHLLGDPTCRDEAARALLPAYEVVKDHRKMVQALDVIAEAATDPIEKVLTLKQAAYIHLNHLRQPELAFAALAKAIELAPADANVRQAARKAAEDAETLDSYAEVLTDSLEKLQGPPSIPVRRELAEVCEKKLGNRPGAVEHLQAILAIDGSNIEALRGLQRLYRAGEDWTGLADASQRLAAIVSEPNEKVALWREAAQIQEAKRADKEAAAMAWRQIATLDPLNREAASALERLYTELDRPQEIAFALEIRRAQEGQSPQGRELTFRLAQLKRARLSDEAGALQLYRQILIEDTGHAGTRQVLEEWVKEQTPESGAALELLDPVLAKSGDHAMRITLREARMTTGKSEERARLGSEVRAIYERDLGQPEAAFMSAVKDFAAGLDRAGAQQDLERLAKETGLYEDLAEIFETAADEQLPGADGRVPMVRRAAELREQLAQNDEAIRLWKDLLVEAPQDRQALDSLSGLYAATKSAKNLAEIYARKAQLAQNPTEKLEALLKAGTAQEEAGEDADAIESFRSALALQKNATALEALDRLFGKERRTREQADVLAQLAELSTEPEVQRGILLRRGLLLEKEAQLPEAADAYARVLQTSPQDAAAIGGLERLLTADATRATAARLLEGVYRSVNDIKKLVEVLDLRLAAAPPERRLEIINEIANLREATGQKALALSARLRAFGEAPELAATRDEAERLAVDTGAYEELAAAFEDQLERGTLSEPVQIDLWRRLAILYQDRLSRMDLAARAWEEVSRREPRDANVLDALARLYRAGNLFKELAHVMRRQIALEPMLEQQVHLLYDLGHLAEESLGDRVLASQCYGEILRRVPEDANAVKALGKVLAESERWPELAQLIAREIQISHQRGQIEEMFELMVRLGRLRLVRLADPRGALQIFQEILKHRPGHPGAVGALEEMARSDSPLRGEAATALEPVFETGGDHLKLVQMLESRVSAETVPQERATLLRRIAELYAGPMDNPALAFVAATKALRELPDDLESLKLCLVLVDKAEATEELTVMLQEVVGKAVEVESRAVLHRTLAARLEAGGDPDGALDNWKRAVELRPGDNEALAATGRLLQKAGRPGELLDILKRQLTVAEDPDRRVALLKQIGRIQEEGLKDNAAALVTFRRLLEIKPEDPEGLAQMEQLCGKQERWPELADVLKKRIQLQGADADLELKHKLAMVREAKLLDKFGAVELYAEVLTAQPNHPGSLQRMEAMVQREPQNQAVVDVLLRAYRATGDVVKLGQLLETRVGISADARERKQLLLELAALRQDAQGEPELAFLAMMRAFREDPNDADLRKRLEQVADAAKTYDELATVYEAELPRVAEASDAAEVCLRLGQLLDQKLSEPERAIEFYEKTQQLDPGVWARALPALDRIYTQLEQWVRLADVLDSLVELTQDPQEKVGLLFRLGQVAHGRLEDPNRAAAAYEKILAIDKTHLASARLLEQLYEAAGNPDKLYEVLKLQRDLVPAQERERILSKMAHVSAEGLSNVDHSIEIYRELLQKNPRNEQAYAALDNLLERGQRWEELKDLLSAKLTQTLDPRELVRLNERLGRALWNGLKRPEEAIPYFKTALERDARHKGALESLREIYDELDRKDDLIVVLRRLIPLQEGAEGVKALRIRMAEVLSELGRREEALDAARRSLEIEPHQPAELDRVYGIFSALKAHGDAVRALELRAHAELGADQRDQAISTLFEVCDLWRGNANKPESAGPVLERILELDPANKTAYEQATVLYAKTGDWRAYAQVVDRYLQHLVTDEEKLVALKELTRIQEQKLGQKDVAFLTACRALQLNPSDHNIREEVERLAEETESYDELAAVYEGVADDLPRGPLAERMYLVLAKVQDQKLDDPAAAEAALRKILEFDPTNELALDALAGMFARRGRDREYIVSLEQKLETAGSIEQRKQILRDIAAVFSDRIGDPREAASALLRAVDLEPDSQTLQALVDLYKKEGQWLDMANTLLRWRDLAPSPEDRAAIQVQVAEVHERELGEDEAAIEGYRQALEFDPTNRDALAALERLYTRLDRPGDLLAVYERQLELTPDYRERVKVLFKSAAIWEDRYQNLANADACIEGVLSLDPQNIQAIKTLERLRKAQQRYEELVGVLERHIQLCSSVAEQSELCVEMGDVFHQQLKQVDRAVSTYHRALELNPKSRPAMHALGTLYERSGNWPFALDMLSQEAQVAGNTPEAVELYHRMGKINEDMLLDPASARSCYEQALRIDPGYLPCIRALKGIFEIEKDWTGFERSLIQEAQETEEPEAKAKALLEVAKYYADQREDRDTATEWYEEALKHAPEMPEAAKPLADIYIAKENWEGGERMLDIVARKMAERAVAEQDEQLAKDLCRQLYRLGYVAEKLGKKEKALGAYEKAYQLDATYLPALEGLGNLLVQFKRYEEALKVYQTILIHHRDDLTDLEVVEIYWQLGDVHNSLKQYDRAQNHFEKALSIDPGHEPSLRALVSLADAAGKFDRAAEYRQSLVNVLDGDAKFQMCVELGILAREKLNDPYMAIDAYVNALKVSTDALSVMDSLYVLYRETKQGPKAGELLERMLQHPQLNKEPQKRKRVYFALGEICRDELKEYDRALEAFNASLDTDYRFIEAFSAIESMLGQLKQWKPLEENYARMIQRLPKTDDTNPARMTLWRALGDLYLQVLKEPDGALMAYQVVAAGMPDDASVQETYAQLAAGKPGEEPKAVEAYRRALPNSTSPGKIASALAEIAARRKDYDLAYMGAQVVSGLIGEAGAPEREILGKLGPYAKKREVAQRPLTDRLWQSAIFHPKVRGPMGELMAILFEQAGQAYAVPMTQYQINPKRDRIDVSQAQEYQIHHYRYVSRLLGMEQVELYSPFLIATRARMAKRSNEPAPDPQVNIEVCHTHPVCLRVGGKFFSESGQKEVYYLLGRTLAMLRPELALSQRLSTERLEAVFQAAVSLSAPNFRFSADPRQIDQERKLLDRTLSDPARAALNRVTREYVKTATPNDLKNYLEGAELTGVRCGFFVASEVEAVKKMVMNESGAAQRVPSRSKIRALMVFALSEDLHALRQAVGTNIEIPQRR